MTTLAMNKSVTDCAKTSYELMRGLTNKRRMSIVYGLPQEGPSIYICRMRLFFEYGSGITGKIGLCTN